MKHSNEISNEDISEQRAAFRIRICQIGARLHYGAARSFERHGALDALLTDICAVKGWPAILRAVPGRLRPAPLRRLIDRVPFGIPKEKIVSFSTLGLGHYLLVSRSKTQAEKLQAYLRSNARFCKKAVRDGLGNATHVYTFAGAALEIVEAAKSAGIWTIVEQPSAAHVIQERIMAEEFARFPDWEEHETYAAESNAYAQREQQEWEIADQIIAPSEFVVDTLWQAGVSVGRCTVVPYGVGDAFSAIRRDRHEGPLRVLCVGSVRLQKGQQYILAASRLLGRQFEFRLVGGISLSNVARRELSERCELTGIVARGEVWKHFQWADVFVLPSLCEGQALVLLEALASGIPVIATPNCGVAIRDGLDGFLVPLRDGAAIADRLDRLASDRNLLREMAHRARERSAEFTLDAYGNRLCGAISGNHVTGEPKNIGCDENCAHARTAQVIHP